MQPECNIRDSVKRKEFLKLAQDCFLDLDETIINAVKAFTVLLVHIVGPPGHFLKKSRSKRYVKIYVGF